MASAKWTFGLGLFCVAFAAFAVFYWIPVDVETGIVEQDRREVIIGDGMAPSFLALCILVLAVAMIVGSGLELLRGRRAATPAPAASEDRDADVPGSLTPSNLGFLLRLFCFVASALVLMVWLGPLTVDAIGALGFEIGNYRQLRDTVPYKYIGFIAGGFVIVFGLISMIEGGPNRRALFTALFTITALIVLYDVPFDQLLLPPNGD